MFERYTNGARRIVVTAQAIAKMLSHDHVGTEHLLLACIQVKVGEDIAFRALRSLGISFEAAREQAIELVETSMGPVSDSYLPFNHEGKAGLENALRESVTQGVSYVGPEHILLGCLRRDGTTAAQILAQLGYTREQVREQVFSIINRHDPETQELNRSLGNTGYTVGQAAAAFGQALNPFVTLVQVLQSPVQNRQNAVEQAPQLKALLDFLVTNGALRAIEPNLLEAIELFVEECLEEHRRSQPQPG